MLPPSPPLPGPDTPPSPSSASSCLPLPQTALPLASTAGALAGLLLALGPTLALPPSMPVCGTFSWQYARTSSNSGFGIGPLGFGKTPFSPEPWGATASVANTELERPVDGSVPSSYMLIVGVGGLLPDNISGLVTVHHSIV